MSELSPRLNLPLIQAAQAQKHVTHNEALRLLDVVAQLAVSGFDETTPPGAPVNGETYAIGTPATGDWVGQEGSLAFWFDASWIFVAPQEGWRAVELGTTAIKVFDGSDWQDATVQADLNNVAGVGINAMSDATNRLSISAAATLLNNEGAGHQLKINKAAVGDTASLLFQTNWSGRAEMGLAGDDEFSVKVSADGSSWDEVMRVGPGEGVVTTANMVGSVSSSPSAGDAVVETGTGANGTYTKLADGTLICQIAGFATASGAVATWTLPDSFANTAYSVTATVTGAVPSVITIAAQATTSVDIHSFDMAGADTASPSVNLIAIGRWF